MATVVLTTSRSRSPCSRSTMRRSTPCHHRSLAPSASARQSATALARGMMTLMAAALPTPTNGSEPPPLVVTARPPSVRAAITRQQASDQAHFLQLDRHRHRRRQRPRQCKHQCQHRLASVGNSAPVIDQGSRVRSDDVPGRRRANPFAISLSATDGDGDELPGSSSSASNGIANGSAAPAARLSSYAPNSDFNGSDSFIVGVEDSLGARDSIRVNITIEAVNDAPVLVTAPSVTGEIRIGEAINANAGTWQDDADGDTISYQFQWHRANNASGGTTRSINWRNKSQLGPNCRCAR